MTKYSIDPDFVVAEPTPADMFDWREMPQTPETFDALVESKRKSMWKDGARQWRVSFFEDGDGGGYPDGVWFEGWKDPAARQLPFGAGWPNKDSAAWPPLTALASGVKS